MNMETWRDRFDEKHGGKFTTAQAKTAVRDFFSAELLLLAEELNIKKIGDGNFNSVEKYANDSFNEALDLAISHLKEAAK